MRRATIALVLAGVVAGCSVGRPSDDASGEEIYAQLCARCHGADLGGGVGPDLGPGSNTDSETDEYIEFTVLNGRGRMPSFSSLDAEQVNRLVEYVREAQEQ